MTDARKLSIEAEVRDAAAILRPIGDIDLSCAASFRKHIASTQAGKPHHLIIDLTGVPYMDSSGVATLVEAMQLARRNNFKLVLCGMHDKVRSIFEIAKLETVFTIVGNCDEALAVS